MKKKYIIGIDTGVNTGVCIYDAEKKEVVLMKTVSILKAFKHIEKIAKEVKLIIVEDARQVRFNLDRAKAQGAGSVKRDCQIWEEFVGINEISNMFVRPNKKITKINAKTFKQITGYTERTNEHNRDAYMLIYKFIKRK